jgi:hypothetical protein
LSALEAAVILRFFCSCADSIAWHSRIAERGDVLALW